MKKNNEIVESTDHVLDQVSDMIDNVYQKTKTVDFSKEISESDITAVRLHLGYAKGFSDLAKVRLQYYKMLS